MSGIERRRAAKLAATSGPRRLRRSERDQHPAAIEVLADLRAKLAKLEYGEWFDPWVFQPEIERLRKILELANRRGRNPAWGPEAQDLVRQFDAMYSAERTMARAKFEVVVTREPESQGS